jgi:hypothetical protein
MNVSSQNCHFHFSSPSFCEAKNQAIALEALVKMTSGGAVESWCGWGCVRSTIGNNPFLSKELSKPVVKTWSNKNTYRGFTYKQRSFKQSLYLFRLDSMIHANFRVLECVSTVLEDASKKRGSSESSTTDSNRSLNNLRRCTSMPADLKHKVNLLNIFRRSNTTNIISLTN